MKHEQQTMQRGLMRMVHAKLAASLGTGRETAAEIKDAKFKMTGFLDKLKQMSKFKKQLQSSWSRSSLAAYDNTWVAPQQEHNRHL